MRSHIFKTGNKGERLFLIVYSLFSFFLGLFISTFDIWVHVSFFSRFGYKYLASSYIASGLFGAAIAYLFSSLFQRLNSKRLTGIVLGGTTILVISIIGVSFFLSEGIASYLGMVVLFPLNMVLLLSMWRYGRLQISERATKKTFQYIKISNYAGMAFGGFSVLTSVFLISFIDLKYFFAIALLAIWLIFYLLDKIIINYQEYRPVTTQYISVKNKTFLFATSRYTRYLYLFALLSAIVGYSIHFAFMNAAWAGFFSIVGITKFYGLFIGLAITLVFGVDKYVIKRVLYAYDSPYSVVILPFLLFVALLSAILGYFLLGNFQPHEHFTIFFLLLTMVNVTYHVSLQTVQKPSLQTLFHSLDIRFRQYAFSKIEGLATMLGLSISGIVILGLSFLKFYSLTIILFFALAVALLWAWVGIKLIREYRKAQGNIIIKMRKRKLGAVSNSFSERARTILSKSNMSKVKAVLEQTKTHLPLEYEIELKNMLRHPSSAIRRYVVKCIERDRVEGVVPELMRLKQEADSRQANTIDNIIRKLNVWETFPKDEDVIRQKVYNGTIEERAILPNVITKLDIPEADSLLTNLSKDPEAEVRHAAVKSMSRRGNKKFSYTLIDFLYPLYFDPYAIDAIAATGDSTLEYLERESNLSESNEIVLSRIMRLYGKIGSERSLKLLLGKLSSLTGYAQEQGIQSLLEKRFQVGESNKFKINSLVIKLCSIVTENLNIVNNLEGRGYNHLYKSFQIELQRNHKKLFQLLSLVYNPNIIQSLQNILMSGSRSQISHGLELADQYIDSDIKAIVFLFFEDVSLDEKLKKLEFYFPQPKLDINEIIRICLTRDFNSLSLFPRACAMLEIYKKNNQEFSEELIFNSEHPEKLLSETALFVLNKLHPDYYTLLLQENQSLIQKRAIPSEDELSLLVTDYSNMLELEAFANISEFVSLKLASAVKKVQLKNKEDSLLLYKEVNKYRLLLCNKDIYSEERNTELILKGNLIPTQLLIDERLYTLKSDEEATVWMFDEEVASELIYDNTDLANTILSGIEKFKTIGGDE